MTLTTAPFGTEGDRTVTQYTITTENGTLFSLIDYGATLTDVRMAGRKGPAESVVTGFDSLEEYRAHKAYFGATVGRVGNRIANAAFTAEGREYKLTPNNGTNNLHGGPKGFDRVLWEGETFRDSRSAGVRFSYTSPEGENGFPGTLKTEVTYTFTEGGEMSIAYRAETDKTTPVNLTNHSYWNLAGFAGRETVMDQELKINGSAYNPVDGDLIPTGIAPVEGTPFDFRRMRTLGKNAPADGYDHNWVLDGEGLREVCVMQHWESGRRLTVLTDQPGMQLYTSGGMGAFPERNGETYRFMAAALETQNFPNAVNEPDFPDCLLRPGEVYESTTVFRLERM